MASSEPFAIIDPAEDSSKFGELALERMEGLLRRACAYKLHASEVATQVLSVIQEYIAFKAQHPDNYEPFVDDTPGAGSMGWELWGTVNQLAREDERHHDALISFINAFIPLIRTQPWQLWGCEVQDSNFFLGPAFTESLEQFDGINGGRIKLDGGTIQEGIKEWVNCCRFVARMTHDTEHDFSMFLLRMATEAVENCSQYGAVGYREASVLALEGVIEVCGVRMFRSEEDYDTNLLGGGGVRKWVGKPGFCKERWMFWEAGLLEIARAEACLVPVRDSAQRTAAKMKAIRNGEISEPEVIDLPSRAAMAAIQIQSMVVDSSIENTEYMDLSIINIRYLYS